MIVGDGGNLIEGFADWRNRSPSLPILARGDWRDRKTMTPFFEDYLTVAVFAGLGAVLVAALLGLSVVLRPNNPTKAKLLTYECGVDPVGAGWSQTYVRYYVYGLLFVIFDVEAVFIFPWAIKLEALGVFGLVEMLVFIVILVLGLVYAIRKGVLKWE